MYSVETEEVAVQQVAALPAEALPFYAELMTVLETAPWSGEAYNRQRPSGRRAPKHSTLPTPMAVPASPTSG